MMKRFFAVLIVLCMLSTAAFAESGEQKSVFDAIGGWFSQAWTDASGWVSQAWTDASKWVEGAWKDASKWTEAAWGDASKWVAQAWNDSSQWVAGIWGDVSSWISGTSESASGPAESWWTKTFNTVTGNADHPWDWLTEEAAALQPETREILSKVKEAVKSGEDDAEAKVKDAFNSLLKTLKLSDDDAQKIWKTMEGYANQKGFSKTAVAKLVLPYLFQLTIDGAGAQNNMPAVAIAQYFMAIVGKLNINSTDTVNSLIDQLNEAFGKI